MEWKKYVARKKRRGCRRRRRAEEKPRAGARARSNAVGLVVHTFSAGTLAFNGRNGIYHSWATLKAYNEIECDVVQLQETTVDIMGILRITFTAAMYAVVCSETDGGKREEKTTRGVELWVLGSPPL